MSRNNSLVVSTLFIVFVIGGMILYSHQLNSKAITSSLLTTQSSQAATVPELASASCHARGVLPDPTCTPGAVDPSVAQDNIDQTICVRGYTKTVRPPTSYTDALKIKQMQAYGFSDNPRSHEEDHLIPLEIGGAPSAPKNLWPEPGNSPNPKDKVEDFLRTAVCDDRISLHDAQVRIATNWTTAENGL